MSNQCFVLFLLCFARLRKNIFALVVAVPLLSLLFLLIYHPLEYLHPLVNHHYIAGDARRHIIRSSLSLPPAQKNFTIHVWNHGARMARRFLRSYGDIERDPFQFCSVRNCILSVNDSNVNKSDAVFFHLHQTTGPHKLPKYHPPHQIWIFFTDESPLHTFLANKKFTMKDYNGLFNWSMTYRSDSDIPVPYGRTVRLAEKESAAIDDLPNYAKRKNQSVAVLGSNCGGKNYRWNYIGELRKHMQIDVYGGCGKLKCPGHFTRDCTPINNYKFYLAFENSNCKEYITEKLWWNAYHKESLPVVMGTAKKDYEKLCPPKSFIHVEDFASPLELAEYIKFLDNNDTAYNQYFKWKKHYKVLNEHGYFGSSSMHLCRICEALNARSSIPKIYDDLGSFWNPEKDCYKPSWSPKPKAAKRKKSNT